MRPLVPLSIAVLLLAACARGADGPPDPGAPASVAEDSAGSPVEPTAESRAIDPREDGLELGFGEWAITLEADAIRPGPVTFVVRNGGTMLHGFEIEAEDDDDGDHSGSGHSGLKFEGPGMSPGDVVRLEADLPAGTYTIECFVDGHDDRGMETTLVVRPDASFVREERAIDGAITIADFAFAPDRVEVAAGTEVVWSNDDPTAHTVTADDGAFDSGTLDPGATFRTVLEGTGTVRYRCLIHPSMQGSITVVGP